MTNERIDDLQIEGAHILFKNFSGKESTYNRAGNRNFSVRIDDPELAQKLADDGWNVRVMQPRDDEEGVRHRIEVTVRFDNIPPKIRMISGGRMVQLDEESVGCLDTAEITNVDLVIHPARWEVAGRSGVKAYLRTMYVTIREDAFASKYADYGI